MKKNDKNDKNTRIYLSTEISLYLCLGIAYGIIFDNLAIGIGTGLCLGTALGKIK